MNDNEKIDVLCIGDTVVDAFIKLKDAEIHCDVNKENCTISMPFGTKIPYESATVLYGVGNSANAAISVSRLGLSSMILTDLGGDDYGEKCIQSFKKDSVDTSFIGVHPGTPTNYHYVLWYTDERTILVKHYPYERSFPASSLPEVGYVYLSSLGGDSMNYHKEISTWLRANPGTKLVFQPGTFQMQVGRKAMSEFYELSHVFVCNIEEANYILETHLEKTAENIKILMQKMAALGPKIILLTDGPAGAYMLDTVTGKNYFMPPYPDPKAPLERTGAGDAFTSTFTTALAYGLSPEQALTWAPINSMNVVQYVGAQEGLLSKDKLMDFLKNAPVDYKPKEI